MDSHTPQSNSNARTLPTGKVLQLHTFPPACNNPDALDVAELLAEHRQRALSGDAVGVLVVTVDENGQWQGHIAGALGTNDQLQASIIGGMMGMVMRGPLPMRGNR